MIIDLRCIPVISLHKSALSFPKVIGVITLLINTFLKDSDSCNLLFSITASVFRPMSTTVVAVFPLLSRAKILCIFWHIPLHSHRFLPSGMTIDPCYFLPHIPIPIYIDPSHSYSSEISSPTMPLKKF